jgi:hypothetical protein
VSGALVIDCALDGGPALKISDGSETYDGVIDRMLFVEALRGDAWLDDDACIALRDRITAHLGEPSHHARDDRGERLGAVERVERFVLRMLAKGWGA